jgi:hypothetical protein
MMMNQSLFWGIPAVVIGIVLVVLACVHTVSKEVAYGIGAYTHTILSTPANHSQAGVCHSSGL